MSVGPFVWVESMGRWCRMKPGLTDHVMIQLCVGSVEVFGFGYVRVKSMILPVMISDDYGTGYE